MKRIIILFLLTVCVQGIKAQKLTSKDSLITRNDSVFIVRYQTKYEFVPDTAELHQRILQINDIIDVFENEQAEIRKQILFFKTTKENALLIPPDKKGAKPNVRKPKRQ